MVTHGGDEIADDEGMVELARIALYVCTYKRNEELERLLHSVKRAADDVASMAAVGVVVVDDNADQRARAVVESFPAEFALGLHYRTSGKQNISLARNVGIEAALEIGDFVAMTDDDIVVPDDWFRQHLLLRERTGADATTGPLLLEFPADAGSWIHDEPFDQFGLLEFEDDALVPICATGNSMVDASFLRENSEIRFDPALGVVGGEDMVFYRAAVAAGLKAHFSSAVAVRELEPHDRSTLRYQLGRAMWMGNTRYVTNLTSGDATKGRLLLRSARIMVRAVARSPKRLAAKDAPQVRYSMAEFSEGLGMLSGLAGVRLDHR